MIREIEVREIDEQEHLGLVEEFTAGLKQQYLMCRTYGHSWMPYTVHSVRDIEGAPAAAYEQVLRCKCKVRRIILLTGSGSVVRQHHDYKDAEGYLSFGIGRIVGKERDILRRTAIERLIERESAA